MLARRTFLEAAWAGLIAGPHAWPVKGTSEQSRFLFEPTASRLLTGQEIKNCPNAVVAILRQFARQPYDERDEPCLESLAALDVEFVPGLADALGDTDDEVRLLSAHLLRELGDKAESALPDMIRSLRDPHPMVRATLAAHVGEFGEKARDALPALETIVDSENVYSRLTAAASIAKIDRSRVAELIPLFVEALGSTAAFVPEYSAWLLRDFEAEGRSALPRLRQMLREGDSTKKSAASGAIWAITGDPSDAIRVGLKLLDNADWLDRVVGAEHLGGLGTAGQPAVPRLLQALKDEDTTVRTTARTALRRIRLHQNTETQPDCVQCPPRHRANKASDGLPGRSRISTTNARIVALNGKNSGLPVFE
jgi:hypothetical protein